jgi:hypothetical protein
MKPLTPAGLAALLHVGRGRDLPAAEVAAEIGGGALAASMAILCGLIKTGAANGPAMRAYLQSLYDGLTPEERRNGAYGLALVQIIAGLDMNVPMPPPLPRLH